MRTLFTVVILLLAFSLIAVGQQLTRAPKPVADKGDATRSTQPPTIQSVNATAFLIGKSWNAYSCQSSYSNQISYDPYTGYIAVVHRTDLTGAGSGRIVYQVSDDGGANWSPQIGPINPSIGGYDANSGRHPSIALINPTKSTSDALVCSYYNNLFAGDWRDIVYTQDAGYDGTIDASFIDSSDTFCYAPAVDLNDGTAYVFLTGTYTYDVDVGKSTDGGATWTKVRIFNDAEAEADVGLNGGWLDIDAAGNVYIVFEGKMRTAPDTVSYYFRYQKSTDAGANWSTPEYVGASIAGVHDVNYQFDCVMDGAGVLHIGAVLGDTSVTPETYALYDITRSVGGSWSATKVADIRQEVFYLNDAEDLYTLNEPHFAKTTDDQNITLQWIDLKESPTSADTLADIFWVTKDASGPSWNSINNMSQTPLVNEVFTKVPRYKTSANELMVLYTLFGPTDLDEADLYFIKDIVTGIKDEMVGVPNKFSLGQNFPNPFNPSTEIKYQLGASAMVTLKVYNIIGQEIATLVNARMSAGEHTARFDASKLPSGVYLYKLQAGSFIDVKKMVLMK